MAKNGFGSSEIGPRAKRTKKTGGTDWKEKLVVIYRYFQKMNFIQELHYYATRSADNWGSWSKTVNSWSDSLFWKNSDRRKIDMISQAYDSLFEDNANLIVTHHLDYNAGTDGTFGHFWDLFPSFYDVAETRLRRTGWFDLDPNNPERAVELRNIRKYARALSAVVGKLRVKYLLSRPDVEAQTFRTDRSDVDFSGDYKTIKKKFRSVADGIYSSGYVDNDVGFWWNVPLPRRKGDFEEHVESLENMSIDEIRKYWNAGEPIFGGFFDPETARLDEDRKPSTDKVGGRESIAGRYELTPKTNDREKTIVVYHAFQKKNFVNEMANYATMDEKTINDGFAISSFKMWNSPKFWASASSSALVAQAYVSLLKENADFLSSRDVDPELGNKGFFGVFCEWSTFETLEENIMIKIKDASREESSAGVIGALSDAAIRSIAKLRVRYLAREFEVDATYSEPSGAADDSGPSASPSLHYDIVTYGFLELARSISTSKLPSTHEFVPLFWNEAFPMETKAGLGRYLEALKNRDIGAVQDIWNAPEEIFLGTNAPD